MRFSSGMDGEIKFRVSADEKRHLKAIARQRNLSLSELLRQVGNIDAGGHFSAFNNDEGC